jgi:uncharacterized protein YqfB (UPF0267 family)
MQNPTKITFYQRFVEDVLSGKKTITIRNQTENSFVIGSVIQASTYEENRWFASLFIEGIEPILFDEINQIHAQQENMSINELKKVIQEIYPKDQQLYVISFKLKE